MRAQVTIKPSIHFGKPCVAGARIPVESVLELVRAGVLPDEMRRLYYPDLIDEDIQACVDYAIQKPRRGGIL